ncbi:P-loop containing nucleoside triphosphate hydrolase protein [Circinella umbellata]|nr:P-loop containing nucleoside triphosphate hydrolase protein [Circinella umbellata]
MNSSNNNNNDRTATFMWDHINSQAYSKAIATTTTTSTATTDNNNNSSNNISVMPKLNRLNIAPMTTSTTPPDLHSLPTKQQPDHPDMTDSSKRRRIDPLPIIDANNHSQHYEHHYRGQQLSVNNNNNFYARPLFSSLPARMNSNLRQLQQQQLFTSPSSSPPQQQAHQIHRSQSLASLRSIDVSSSMQQQQQQQQYPYALPPAHHSRPSAPTLSPSLSMQTVTDLYRQQQQQSRPQSQPLIRHHHHSNNEHSSSTITTVQQQQYQQVSSAPSSLSFIKTTPSPQQQQLAGEDDDDLIVDEEMTNKNVCIGMIKTDIVTVRPLDLIKDEQFEPIRLESEGKRDSVNYSFTVTSRGTPRKFYGWVPFEDTKILGPLVDHRLIWWDALIPRGKINHARTPLYIILYCRPSHVDIISKSFECYHATLKEPPFFNPACRYKNPHQQLLLRQQQQQLDNNNRLWSVGRPGGGGSRSYSPALLSEQQQQATEQTRRDIAQLLDSIDDEANRRKLRKRKKRQEKLQKIGTKDNQIVLSDDDDNNNGERNNNRSNDMNDGNEKMAIDEINKEDDGDEDDEEGTQVDGLTVKLMPHQSRGVDWMIGREANETSSGGILADMGLGKTIQTIGLMVSTMEAAAKRPTLIITPLALIQQWATEIRTKTEKGKVSVLVYHGANRSKDPSVFLQYDVVITTYQVVASDIPNTTKRGRRRNINSLNNNTNDSGAIDEEMTDIQTPGVSEDSMTPSSSAPGSPNNRKLDDHSKNNNKLTKPGYGPLFQIEWYRVVLDEAQQIKNRNTRSALSCTELGAKKRWCLTGTPMQNHVDELYSLLRFLRIQPLCDFQSFKKTISIPIQAGQGQLALERLKVVLMAVMLRRTKQILKSRQEAEEQDEDEEEGRTQEEQPRASSSTTTASVSGVVTEEATLGSNNSHGSSPATSSLLSSNVQPKKEYSESSNLSTELSLKLPPRNKRDVVLTFSSAERKFYDFLNTKTKSTVERLFRAGKGERNYLNMLCMLLRLRQACDHPKLVLKAMGNDADALDELSTAAARNNNNSVSPSSSSSISNSGAGGRKDAREANSEAIAQRTIMAKMAADLGWQGVGQVGQSVFDKDSNNGNTNSGEGSLCELCGRINNTKSRSGSYCSACTKQIEFYTQQQQQDQQDDDTNISLMTTSSKSNKVLEILNETRLKYPREKTIIFSQFTSMLDLMEEQLQRSGFKYCRYDGSMSNHLREKNLDALRTDNECTIMLISLKCGSLGLNLTAANHVILMDVWWNPSVEEQAIDRVHRIGQRKPVRVVRLVIDGTIEQKIIKLQQKKAQMVQGALGDGMIKNSKLTMREIRTLFDL